MAPVSADQRLRATLATVWATDFPVDERRRLCDFVVLQSLQLQPMPEDPATAGDEADLAMKSERLRMTLCTIWSAGLPEVECRGICECAVLHNLQLQPAPRDVGDLDDVDFEAHARDTQAESVTESYVTTPRHALAVDENAKYAKPGASEFVASGVPNLFSQLLPPMETHGSMETSQGVSQRALKDVRPLRSSPVGTTSTATMATSLPIWTVPVEPIEIQKDDHVDSQEDDQVESQEDDQQLEQIEREMDALQAELVNGQKECKTALSTVTKSLSGLSTRLFQSDTSCMPWREVNTFKMQLTDMKEVVDQQIRDAVQKQQQLEQGDSFCMSPRTPGRVRDLHGEVVATQSLRKNSLTQVSQSLTKIQSMLHRAENSWTPWQEVDEAKEILAGIQSVVGQVSIAKQQPEITAGQPRGRLVGA